MCSLRGWEWFLDKGWGGGLGVGVVTWEEGADRGSEGRGSGGRKCGGESIGVASL